MKAAESFRLPYSLLLDHRSMAGTPCQREIGVVTAWEA